MEPNTDGDTDQHSRSETHPQVGTHVHGILPAAQLHPWRSHGWSQWQSLPLPLFLPAEQIV